jgi:hypothetical protein
MVTLVSAIRILARIKRLHVQPTANMAGPVDIKKQVLCMACSSRTLQCRKDCRKARGVEEIEGQGIGCRWQRPWDLLSHPCPLRIVAYKPSTVIPPGMPSIRPCLVSLCLKHSILRLRIKRPRGIPHSRWQTTAGEATPPPMDTILITCVMTLLLEIGKSNAIRRPGTTEAGMAHIEVGVVGGLGGEASAVGEFAGGKRRARLSSTECLTHSRAVLCLQCCTCAPLQGDRDLVPEHTIRHEVVTDQTELTDGNVTRASAMFLIAP